MRERRLAMAFLCAALVLSAASTAAAPRVVASIMPVHSLVAGVMQGIGEPTLLIRGYGSPHTYTLRPSDAAALARADVVFWVGETLERFLRKPLSALAGDARVVSLIETEGLTLHRYRGGGVWEAAGHGSAQTADAHIWLDPDNAVRMVSIIARHLAAVDPANAPRYEANAKGLRERVQALDQRLAKQLRPLADVPFVVFHDAFQYFERHYALNAAGAVTAGPERRPGARRIRALRERIQALGVRCVFTEPQFESALIETVIEGTGARRAALDPLGAALVPGAGAYLEMMERNAAVIVECLSG